MNDIGKVRTCNNEINQLANQMVILIGHGEEIASRLGQLVISSIGVVIGLALVNPTLETISKAYLL